MDRIREIASRYIAVVWLFGMAASLLVGPAQPAMGQTYTYTTLYSFRHAPDGNNPLAGVLRDPQGNLYGTTTVGGAANRGSVFEIDSSGNESILYSFTGPPDGLVDSAPLSRDSMGYLYGVAEFGGTFGYGTVYKVSKLGVETILYNFTGVNGDANPVGGLIRDSAGNLYGTTGNVISATCSANCGTVFKVAPDGTETVLHVFSGTNGDGAYPQGLIRDKNGNFFGFTWSGGNLNCNAGAGCGVVFKIDTTGKETILYTFAGGSAGQNPIGVPVLDSSGSIYGMTTNGGDMACVLAGIPAYGCGTVFKVNPQGKEAVLHAFHGSQTAAHPADGASPDGGLVRDAAGNLYGSTSWGGNQTGWNNDGCGIVFKISPAGNETILYVVPEYQINGTLTIDSSGNFYGTTPSGGDFQYGSVFKLTP